MSDKKLDDQLTEKIIYGICLGMDHLHRVTKSKLKNFIILWLTLSFSTQEHIIHRDLAARNLLLTENQASYQVNLFTHISSRL